MNADSAWPQLMRYGVVGLASNGLLYLAYLGMTAWGIPPKLAMSLAYLAGVVQTFVFNRHWTFRSAVNPRSALLRYGLAYGLGYGLNWLGLRVFVDGQGYPHQFVQGLLIFGIAMLLFLLQRRWVFAAPPFPMTRP